MARGKFLVVGFGDRMTGVSKSKGKPYDFQSVSVLYNDKFTTGHKAATIMLDGADLDAINGVAVNDELDVAYHVGPNNCVYVDAVITKADGNM